MATKKASKQAASRELTMFEWKLREIRQNWVAYLMIAPYMILFTLFTIVPVLLSIFIGFTDFNMLEFPNIVWMKNYVTLFSSDTYGWANATLMKLGIIQEEINWFRDETYVMPLCIIVSLWTSLGTSFLSFIAGLQGIDRALFEAGAVDGVKNRWQELYYITLPSMKPQLMFGAVMSITGAFGFGGIVDALAGFPSVNYCAHTIMHHLNDYGGMRYEIGYSSAIAVLLFLMMIGANMLVKRLLSKIGT